MDERINLLIEKRIHEAAKKEITKKSNVIVKAFGQPIIEHQVSYYESLFFDESQQEDFMTTKGYYYYALNRGINMCIKLLFYDFQFSEIKIHFEGELVFHEVDGNVESFIPSETWESKIEQLYEEAVVICKKKLKIETEEREINKKAKAKNYISEFRQKWGY